MCSTPQKHPAAIVAFCAPSGLAIEDSGFRERRVVVVKGRMMRLMKVGIVKAIRKTSAERRRVRCVRDGRLNG
jgi:hypothetical protein